MDPYSFLAAHSLTLASASPRRRDLLAAARIPCRIHPADIPEILAPGEAPAAYVSRLARSKAHALPIAPGELILAADTTVVADAHVLEKPADAPDAARMLSLLSGRSHTVLTAICLRTATHTRTAVESTLVHVSPLTPADIDFYIASGEAYGKAGAYGIQGIFSRWVQGIEGCYFNVVGLPLSLLWRELAALAACMDDGSPS